MSVNNSLNMLLSYPHKKHELGSDWISIDQSAVTELFNRLRGRRGENLFDQRM